MHNATSIDTSQMATIGNRPGNPQKPTAGQQNDFNTSMSNATSVEDGTVIDSASTNVSDTSSLNDLVMTTAPTDSTTSSGKKHTWYEAMAEALGSSLDAQASKIESLSQAAVGNDTPSSLLAVTTAAQKFSFMATSASTAVNSAGEGNKTLARKE